MISLGLSIPMIPAGGDPKIDCSAIEEAGREGEVGEVWV